jgi:hypothetical protein
MENGISTWRSVAEVSKDSQRCDRVAPRPYMARVRGDDRYCFLVVEETLTTETIAEYRRSRAPRRRPRGRIRAFIAAQLKQI